MTIPQIWLHNPTFNHITDVVSSCVSMANHLICAITAMKNPWLSPSFIIIDIIDIIWSYPLAN